MRNIILTLVSLALLIGCQTQPASPTGPKPIPAPAPNPAPAPAPSHTISAVPLEGTHSADVRVVQERLNAAGASLNVDGAFGPATTAAIGAFQKSKSLPMTSSLDDATIAALGITLAGQAPGPAPSPGPIVLAPSSIVDIAAGSQCSKTNWAGRGTAPRGYYRGIALVFAKAVCHPDRPDVQLVSKANSGDDAHDALSWYKDQFAALGMENKGGVDTLRHTYALMLGLGLRESSGVYCCGRDMSAGFSSSDSAEAGTFQTSWGVSRVAPAILSGMFNQYKASPNGCFLEIFKEGIGSCSAGDWKNWGSGDGLDWQRVTKSCPAFGAEYASVILRKSGGSNGEFGPLRHHAAELKPECDAMLLQVQKAVEAHPELCKSL
jgi:peptidoglycan hydrolase-like protein with peptidoglycan-binding domain